MIILAIIFGAFVYRMRGGMKPSFPRPFDQVIFSLPFGYVAYAEAGIVLGLVCLVLTAIAVSTGHGGAMDLGSWMKERDDERLEFIVKPLRGKISGYWYDVILLAVTGVVVSLPVGIITMNPFLALSGLMKAPAYMLAKKADAGTEGGELLTGATLWGALI